MQRRGASGQPVKDRRNRAIRPKARKAPTARLSNATLRKQLDQRTRERDEALEQLTATSEVLQVISQSTFDLQSVLSTLVHAAGQLCQAENAQIFLRDGEVYRLAADNGFSPEYQKYVREHPIKPGRNTLVARTALEGKTVHIHDTLADPEYTFGGQKLGGYRTMLGVPLIRDENCIGVIALTRSKVHAFTDNQITLVTNFAAQALVAIENARLLNELRESLQQQTATADVLKVISRSAFDLQTVLDTLTELAAQLCDAESAHIFRCFGTIYRLAACRGYSREYEEHMRQRSFEPGRDSTVGRIALEHRMVHIPDVLADPEYSQPESQKLGRWRTMLGVPLMREGVPIGALTLTRSVVKPFTDSQIELVTIFADQAVIAIENVRLFDEVQAKTRDLAESLQQQTATGDVLKVIASSPTDVGPALQAIVESACAFCNAYDAGVLLKIGNDLHFSAHHGPIRTGQQPRPISREWVVGRSVLDKVPVQVSDFQAPEAAEFPEGQRQSREQGHRSTLSVPLLREGEAIGAIALRRVEPVAFTNKQVALLQTFADQAVIAIGNVQLFDEVQARTRDLTESLQQQTATSEVLQVISSSPGELEPVFQTMLENATRICAANFGTMYRYDGAFHLMASHNAPLALVETRLRTPVHLPPPDTGRDGWSRTKQVVHIRDIATEPGYTTDHSYVAGSKLSGARTVLIVPMLKDAELAGSINIFRQEVRPFTDKQVALLSNFAKQAVIAIENTRLLKELRQRTGDLSQSLDDLRTAQDRLVQTEKLASLGQLTAGIAHEIKNPLNFVNNFSALSAELTDELNDALKPVAMDGKVREEVDELTGMLKDNLEKVVQHGKRADSIVKNMLLHSREGSREHRPADINSLLDESLNLAYHGARAEKGEFNITLQRDFDADAGTIELFPQEITRAFLNLIANGVYAMTKRKTEEKEPGFEPTLRAATKNLGTTVEIRIRDNGTGIPPEVQEKMFNPFFTTKPAGEGTGLGLSMTHDIIVKQHGGRIDVETEPGNFTEFIITLPRTAITQKTAGGTN